VPSVAAVGAPAARSWRRVSDGKTLTSITRTPRFGSPVSAKIEDFDSTRSLRGVPLTSVVRSTRRGKSGVFFIAVVPCIWPDVLPHPALMQANLQSRTELI
jgi:hypothetical protein